MTGMQVDGQQWKRPTKKPADQSRIKPHWAQPVMPQHIHDYGAEDYRCTYCRLTQGQLALNTARLKEVM